jgi:cytochrome oxidase assembly protein ShyY1
MENKFIMHVGYAIQWLLIALACLIGFLYVSRSEQQENE